MGFGRISAARTYGGANLLIHVILVEDRSLNHSPVTCWGTTSALEIPCSEFRIHVIGIGKPNIEHGIMNSEVCHCFGRRSCWDYDTCRAKETL